MFNHEIAVDLLWLDSKPVFHIVDTHTLFQNAAFVKYKTSECIWQTFLDCWATVYLGYPENIRLDHETSFNSVKFRQLCNNHGVNMQLSGV